MNILVTGGAGFIGSHTVVELIAAGFNPVIADNLSNSDASVIDRLKQITGREIPFLKVDLCDKEALQHIFESHSFDAAIHFAGLKAVGESVAKPLWYYHNNLVSTLHLLEMMTQHHVPRLIFSSSATVYGTPDKVPIPETAPLRAQNPYGQTKLMIEQILKDTVAAEPDMQVTALRYFNPIGAHPSGLIGENPNGTPNNLLPYVARVAASSLPEVQVFGDDYPTPDGTGVRDYIHVVDLARGHVSALQNMPAPGTYEAYNLGTGRGHSVLEVIAAFEKASGKPIPYKTVGRRPGDAATSYADPSKARKALHWSATKTLEAACTDMWRYQQSLVNHQVT